MSTDQMAERMPSSSDTAQKPKSQAVRPGHDRRIGRRAAIGLIAGGVAGTVLAVETGAAQTVLKTVIEKGRDILKPQAVQVYAGEITIPLDRIDIQGQARVTNPSRREVNPRYVKGFNGVPYNQERFMTITNGTIVQGEGGKFLEIKVDDANPTGQYYSYVSLNEDAQSATGKLDPSKFIGIKRKTTERLILNNGTSLKYQGEINITSFR